MSSASLTLSVHLLLFLADEMVPSQSSSSSGRPSFENEILADLQPPLPLLSSAIKRQFSTLELRGGCEHL